MLSQLQETVKEIIVREDVKYVIGYTAGSYGWRVAPFFAKTADDADRLIFSPFCINNLAAYLALESRSPLPESKKDAGKKVGVIVKGCDSRAISLLLQENLIARDEVIIIGIPCRGIINPQKMHRVFGDILERVSIEETGDIYQIGFNGTTKKVSKEELLADVCKSCRYQTPLLYDILLDKVIPTAENRQSLAVEGLKKQSIEERWAYWKQQFDRCIRCYACRHVCPVCNCEECMAEALQPNWIRRSVNTSENTAYHAMRAYHMAGRCVSCGMCEHACPVDIPLTTLYQKVTQDVLELFDYTSGIPENGEPLLSVYNVNDLDDGIL